jgi:hypothetical protein
MRMVTLLAVFNSMRGFIVVSVYGFIIVSPFFLCFLFFCFSLLTPSFLVSGVMGGVLSCID